MPIVSDMNETFQQVRLLLIGNSKAGKTHYAGQAAADGFKVLYVDGDVSRPTLASFPKEAKERIFYLPFSDAVSDGGQYVPRFSLLTRKLLSTGNFEWNDSKSRMLQVQDAGDSIYNINVAKLDHTWVLVLDSWTGMAHSIMSMVAINAGVDLADMDKAGQSIYGSANNMATDILARLRSLNCHVIVIAHPDEFVKYKVKKGSVRDNQRTENREVESTRSIPKSVSRPHGMTLASYFTDVAWAEVSPMGRREMNFEVSNNAEGGGRFDGKLPIDEASFANLVKRAGGEAPKNLSLKDDPAVVHNSCYEPPAGIKQTPSVVNPSPASAPSKINLGVGTKKPTLNLSMKK